MAIIPADTDSGAGGRVRFPPFTGKETSSERLRNLFKAAQVCPTHSHTQV